MFTIVLLSSFYGKFKTRGKAEEKLKERGYKKVERGSETIYRLPRPKEMDHIRPRFRWYTAIIFEIPTYKFNKISDLISWKPARKR